MHGLFHDDTLLARWLSGEITEAEQEELRRHPDFPAFRRIVEAADQLQLPDSGILTMWDRLEPNLKNKKTQSYGRRRERWMWFALAISAVFTLGVFAWTLWWPLSNAPAIVATSTGEQKTATLPDGSTVRLNAVSSVEVYIRNWSKERRVHLIGDAFFQVENSTQPFVVETGAGTVSVLGTTFTVRHRGSSLDVACYTGLVQAATSSGAKQALREGQKATARNGIWQPIGTLTDSWPAWMQGESRFANAPLYEVFAELQRQYDISIAATGTENRRFSGAFVHGDLPLALRMICEPLGLQYTVQNSKVMVSGK